MTGPTVRTGRTAWAFQLQPGEQELLSNYLSRVAHGHGSTAGAFCRLHLSDSWYWTRDVDRGIAIAAHERLSSLAGVDVEVIERLTLRRWIEGLTPASYRAKSLAAITPWVTAAGLSQANRRHPALSYCPQCLDERGVAVKAWRLVFHTQCAVHRRPLIDDCRMCGAFFVPHLSRHSTRHCWSCGHALSESNWMCGGARDMDEAALQMQFRMHDWLEAACNGDLRARHRMHALRMLISVGWSGRANGRSELAQSSAAGAESGGRRLETAPLPQRALAMRWLHELVSQWPQSFHQIADAGGLTQRTFCRLSIKDTWLLEQIENRPAGLQRATGRRLDAVQQTLQKPLRHNIGNWRAGRARALMRQAVHGH